MAANFYLSSHANYHLHPRSALLQARALDLKHATEQELGWIEIWSASAIQKICKRLSLRQQVISTAIVYFRRFYLRNSYCETDPTLVAAAAAYVAAKAEETPVHVKSALVEARGVFTEMGVNTFPTDNTKLAEMEFYLIEELDFHLVVFHPYRSLLQLCGRDGRRERELEREKSERKSNNDQLKAGEVPEGWLELDETALQMAWFIINDTHRLSLCLLYPPHLIALASLYLALSLHPPAPPSDPVPFLASLNVDFSIVMEIVQSILALYELWNSLEGNESGSSTGGIGIGIGIGIGPGIGPGTGVGIGTGTGMGKAKEGKEREKEKEGKMTSAQADERVVRVLERMRRDRDREREGKDREREKAMGGAAAATATREGGKAGKKVK